VKSRRDDAVEINANQIENWISVNQQRKKGSFVMSFQDVSAEQLAELFHHYHQALGPDLGCAGKPSRAMWQEVSQQEKSRMVAAARLTLLELDSTHAGPRDGGRENSRKYFAPAGEAEWGC
jgi:hypothetical protein